eukprot:TRINITY_DN2535_c0_g1_i1.p1 TRINITY_DN2535_c0_g1~~TRINITY_DN2535_c0_g1_i1.p1  ORF type:complete len:423 (-),score=108.94 TRINITY_DN2535_c0_g1_i1:28-1296(-)
MEEEQQQLLGEPEVFETEDAVEQSFSTSSHLEKIPDHLSDSIDSLKINVEDSRGKFVTKNLDTSLQDYSESIVSFRRRRQQSQRNQSEYEMLGEEADENNLLKKETNLQKFNRLQFEITQFITQIADSGNEKDHDDKSNHSNSSIATELNLLRHQLESLSKNEQTAKIINPKIDIQQSAALQQNLSNKLLQQISTLVSHSNSTQENGDLQKASNPSLTYELYLTPDHTKLREISKTSSLEQRIAHLEELVGGQQLNPSGLGKPILEVVEQLKEKSDSLSSPSNIADLQKNVQLFNHQIETAIEKKKAFANIAPAINEQKINELFDIVNKWDVTAQQLPSIVQRLQSLRNLHEQSISFVNTVQQVESQQEEMRQLLQSNNELASKLEGNFSSNMNVIQSNISSLEKRFDDLRRKLEAMGLETF